MHVANTEQRIAFQEVTLLPKVPSAKGKERTVDGNEEVTVDFVGTSAADGRTVQIERLTGLSAPVGRAPRRAKSAASSKAPARPKRRASTRSRTKEVDYEELDQPNPQESSPADDDDMYMDT